MLSCVCACACACIYVCMVLLNDSGLVGGDDDGAYVQASSMPQQLKTPPRIAHKLGRMTMELGVSMWDCLCLNLL